LHFDIVDDVYVVYYGSSSTTGSIMDQVVVSVVFPINHLLIM